MSRPFGPAGLLGPFGPAGLLGLLCLPVGACSTLASPDVNERCQSDDECPNGLECNLDQGGVCLEPPEGRPPRSSFAFAIQEGSLDVELGGCDAPVRLDGVELDVRREDVVQELAIAVEEWVETVDFVCQPGYEPDLALEVCRGPLESTVAIRQASRFGRRRPAPSVVFTPEDSTAGVPNVVWSSAFAADEPPLIAEVRPSLQLPGVARGAFRRWLARAELGTPAALDLTSRYSCHRALSTTVRTIDGSLEADVGLTARLRSPVATPETVVPSEAAPSCEDDTTCGAGRACPPEIGRCGLDLTGTIAATFTSDAGGSASTFMYDDCESSALEVVRDLQLDVVPPPTSGLPSVRAAAVATFAATMVGQTPPPTVVPDVCLPSWLPAHEVVVSVTGTPLEVLRPEGSAQPWTCCSVDCLPADGVVEGITPPPPPSECGGFESLRLESRLSSAEFDPSSDATCAPLLVDDEGILGRYQSTVSGTTIDTACDAEGRCTMLAATGDGTAPRAHRLTLVQPRESVFRSDVLDVSIPADEDALPAIELRPRVQLRGQVVCAPDIPGCTPSDAIVFAERLRLDGDEGFGIEAEDTVLAPYVFSIAALADGSFSLPVNPGVYVVTVFPAPASRGGPGRFVVLDLRDDAPGVDLVEGVPVLGLADPLVIEAGRTVRISLQDFSAITRVFAFDTGTWALQGDVPVDLNAPGTCWNDDPTLGCVIRALNQGVALYASGKTEFTVRDRGTSNCP